MSTNIETENVKQLDTPYIYTNAEENQNKEKCLVQKIEPYKDTPFHIAETTEGYCILIGNNRVTDLIETKEECIEKIETKCWSLITAMYFVLQTTKQN
ncbi:MAG: hypothetical protein [Microviridae sp.]|nr:MAG: hypothetical protein [Microviridae sp.]